MEAVLDPCDPLARVAGRRLVRRLGSGHRWTAFSTVLVDDDAPSLGAHPARPTLASDAVLLRATADAAERGLWRRAAILSRLEHPHVLRLLDVAEDVHGMPCLLVERLSGGTLADLLRRRETLAPGEAVTILAPIAEAVQAAHLAGVRHGSISPKTIVFASDGRPVLAGWSDATHVGDGGGVRAAIPNTASGESFLADWEALAAVADAVFQATPHGPTPSFTTWVAHLGSGAVEHELANRFQQRLHARARPLPVLLGPVDDRQLRSTVAVRSVLDAMSEAAPGSEVPTTRRAARDGHRRHRAPGGATGPTTVVLSRAWSTLTRRGRAGGGTTEGQGAGGMRAKGSGRARPSRRRLAIGAVAAAGALATTVTVLLPPGDEAVDSQPAGFAESSVEAPVEQPVETTVAPSAGTGGPGPDAGDDDPLTGPDPVLAAARLVTLRSDCSATEPTHDCVLTYAEASSPFHESELVGGLVGHIEVDGLQLVDRQGDAAILRGLASAPGALVDDERQPVTLLVLRGETGWRLREVFTAG
ncbi:hypothetical protein KXS11_05525 [Plantibacter flavus]|uniref:protein kinase domain-containing protein n=1 Tax=Plantibacter flavus TaxID=150123 RepID=UPI003F18B1CF